MLRRTSFALLPIAVILLLSACSSDDSYPTSTAVVTGADEASTEAFQTVNDSYDLYNTGDIEAWVEVRDSGSVWPSEDVREEGMAEIAAELQVIYDAGGRYIETVCISQGLNDWPSIADGGAATGYLFTCSAVFTFDFEDSNARTVPEAFNWVVNDSAVVAVNSEGAF